LNLYRPEKICNLLLAFKADAHIPGILAEVISKGNFYLLQTFLKSGANLEEQGAEALVASASKDDLTSAAFLLDSGVNVDTPGLKTNPLQAAAREGNSKMVELLLSYKADINAPAYLNGGRTALQSALEGEDTVQVASLLLDKGADVFAPAAILGGVTALEALCGHWSWDTKDHVALCSRLLDLGAPVIRSNSEPSSVLHRVISKGWDGIFLRVLEPQRNVDIEYMWCDMEFDEEEYEDAEDDVWEPRTPIQLAADFQRVDYVNVLLERGADINKAPAYRFGRTALQAAASKGNMELVQLLLAKGAHVNAKPAIEGGVTALQGAAISGNITVAKLLLDTGAEVNARPSFSKGRYAIEGAAEHGRLDMVQLLLNAGAEGNVYRGTGFKQAIKLAENNGHFAIANLLKDVEKIPR